MKRQGNSHSSKLVALSLYFSNFLLARFRIAFRISFALALLLLAWWNVREARRIDLTVLQDRAEVAIPLAAHHSLAQSFTPRVNHLTALEFNAQLVRVSANPNASLTLHLRRALTDTNDLAASQISLASLRANPQFTFSFPPEAVSQDKTYFVLLETDAEADTLALWASSDKAFDNGALYVDGKMQTNDLAVRAYGEIEWMDLFGDLFAHADAYVFLLALTFAFGFVGMGLLVALRVQMENGIITALYTSLALAPILYALLGIFNLPLYRVAIIVISVLAVLFAGFFLARARVEISRTINSFRLAHFLLAFFFLCALATRVLQSAEVDAPLWVDGLTHENFVEAIIARGGIPSDTLYHVGFHSLVAFLNGVTNLDPPALILLVGAWLSALTGLSVFVLARKIFADDFAALTSACILWFFAPFPAYLITWSRSPFLLGLAFLPVAVTVSLDALERGSRARIGIAALLVAGLALSHYGTLSFWAMFVLVWFFIQPSPLLPLPFRERAVMRGLRFVLIILPTVFLLGARLAINLFNPRLGALVASSRAVAEQSDPVYLFQITLRYGGLWVWSIGILGMILALVTQRKIFLLLGGWFFAEFLLARVQAPFFGEVIANMTNWMIALSLPLALFGGAVAKWLMADGRWQSSKSYSLSAICYLLVLSFIGGRNSVGIVNPATVQFTPADARAMEWIQTNTPTDAAFLANSFYWGETRYLPVDGGGWIRAFTQRAVQIPLTAEEAQRARDLIRAKNITYVYLGRGSGSLERARFDSPDEFELVYDHEGVRIYQVKSKK